MPVNIGFIGSVLAMYLVMQMPSMSAADAVLRSISTLCRTVIV